MYFYRYFYCVHMCLLQPGYRQRHAQVVGLKIVQTSRLPASMCHNGTPRRRTLEILRQLWRQDVSHVYGAVENVYEDDQDRNAWSTDGCWSTLPLSWEHGQWHVCISPMDHSWTSWSRFSPAWSFAKSDASADGRKKSSNASSNDRDFLWPCPMSYSRRLQSKTTLHLVWFLLLSTGHFQDSDGRSKASDRWHSWIRGQVLFLCDSVSFRVHFDGCLKPLDLGNTWLVSFRVHGSTFGPSWWLHHHHQNATASNVSMESSRPSKSTRFGTI